MALNSESELNKPVPSDSGGLVALNSGLVTHPLTTDRSLVAFNEAQNRNANKISALSQAYLPKNARLKSGPFNPNSTSKGHKMMIAESSMTSL